MNENGDKTKIEAGKAFMAAIESDSEAKQSLANAVMKLRMFAASAQATMLPLRPAGCTESSTGWCGLSRTEDSGGATTDRGGRPR